MCLQSKRRDLDLDDPRPPKFRRLAGYQDHVRNCIVNYVSKTGDDLVIRYLYDRAELQAASVDHTYSQLPFLEHWVDNRNAVNERDTMRIETASRGQAKTLVWRTEREWRLTAFSFCTICKLTERRNLDKLCATLVNPQELNVPAIQHGRRYESVAIAQYETEQNVSVRPAGLHIRPDYPYLGASPDGIIDNDTILEVKCPFSGKNEMIAPGEHFKFLKSENGELALNTQHDYYFQVQGQLFISKAKVCHFCVYTLVDFKMLSVSIDDEYCSSSLIPKLECFYTKTFRKFVAKML